MFFIELRKGIKEICKDLSHILEKSDIFMNGLDKRILCMRIKPADVTKLNKFLCNFKNNFKNQNYLDELDNARANKHIGNNCLDTNTTSLG